MTAAVNWEYEEVVVVVAVNYRLAEAAAAGFLPDQ